MNTNRTTSINLFVLLMIVLTASLAVSACSYDPGFGGDDDSGGQAAAETPSDDAVQPEGRAGAEESGQAADSITQPSGALQLVLEGGNVYGSLGTESGMTPIYISDGLMYYIGKDSACSQSGEAGEMDCSAIMARSLDSGGTRQVFSAGGDILLLAIIEDGKAYLDVSSMEERGTAFAAVDLGTGEQLWRRVVSDETCFQEVAGGNLYCHYEDERPRTDRFIAIDKQTGAEKWRLDRGAKVVRDAATADTVYILEESQVTPLEDRRVRISYESNIKALDPETGGEQWSYSSGKHFVDYRLCGDTLIVTGVDAAKKNGGRATVVAVDAATGGEKWQLTADTELSESSYENFKIVGSFGNRVYLVDSRMEAGPSELVPVASAEATLYALDIDSGEESWSREINDDPSAMGREQTVAIDAGTIYTFENMNMVDWENDYACIEMGQGCADSYPVQTQVTAINAETGEQLWQLLTEEKSYPVPNWLSFLTIADDAIFFSDSPFPTWSASGDIGAVYRLR